MQLLQLIVNLLIAIIIHFNKNKIIPYKKLKYLKQKKHLILKKQKQMKIFLRIIIQIINIFQPINKDFLQDKD